MKNINKINFIILILLFLLILPGVLSAQTVSFTSDKSDYSVGSSFLVQLMLDAKGQPINSLGGTVIIPPKLFNVSDIQTGGSFISLWINRPKLENNEIRFSGGTPGGYSGSRGVIFTFVLTAKSPGAEKLVVKDFEAFLNDGQGTAVTSVVINPLNLSISPSTLSPAEKYQVAEDTIPPEGLILTVSRDEIIENNKYFVSFFAVDKDSGIAKYEVEEDPWIASWFGVKKVWIDAQSPQVLEHQKWLSTIKVRAYDLAGNVTAEKVIKPLGFDYIVYGCVILVVLSIIVWYIKSKKRCS